MATEPKPITVDPSSELAAWLNEAARSPVFFEKDGRIFRLSLEPGQAKGGQASQPPTDAMHAATRTWGKVGLEGFRARVSKAGEQETPTE
jgi:hypothetical protein